MNIDILFDFLLRILPGLVLVAIYLSVIPRKAMILRLVGYINLFLYVRDAMTPVGLWSFGTEGFFWMRIIHDPFIQIYLGLTGLATVLLMNKLDPKLKSYLIYFKDYKWKGILVGLLGALVVTAPMILIYQFTPIELRGGGVSITLLPSLLIFTLLGNFYEETLFRGYLQGYLESEISMKPIKAAVCSGIAFGFGHIFLASTVTNVGAPLLIFATYEGIIAGFIRMKYGVIPATLTHGLAVFIISSGLF